MITKTQNFNFEFDVEVFQKAAPDGKEWRIGGIVSTDGLDRQGETLLQEGLDFHPFLKGGYFNDNHDAATEAAVGYPTKAELRELPNGRKGWYVEGYLLKGHKRAESLWDLANALQKSDRRLGFSVEGQIVERDPTDPKKVKKAIVREVAITRCPVNTETSLNVLAKSLAMGTVGNPGSGAPLAPESLEKDLKVDEKDLLVLSEKDAVDLLCKLDSRLTENAAKEIVRFAMRHSAAK